VTERRELPRGRNVVIDHFYGAAVSRQRFIGGFVLADNAPYLMQEMTVRTTITVDDELYRQALELAEPGIEKADLLREAMRVFVRVQSGKRLAALGGKSPNMANIPLRRPA
jgi:Arc/MetJ family transcription regulator